MQADGGSALDPTGIHAAHGQVDQRLLDRGGGPLQDLITLPPSGNGLGECAKGEDPAFGASHPEYEGDLAMGGRNPKWVHHSLCEGQNHGFWN